MKISQRLFRSTTLAIISFAMLLGKGTCQSPDTKPVDTKAVDSKVVISAEPSPILADSTMGKADRALQRLLITSLQNGAILSPTNGFAISTALAQTTGADLAPHLGQSAVKLKTEAQQENAKANYKLTDVFPIPGTAHMLGMWIYLASDSNVNKVGLEVEDNEGENLEATIPADWTGWKWFEADLSSGFTPSSSSQTGKNGKVDLPLKNIRAVWRTKAAGPTNIVINSLCALTDLSSAAATPPPATDTSAAAATPASAPEAASPPPPPIDVSVVGATFAELNAPLSTLLAVTNRDSKAISATVEYSVQHDSSMLYTPPPDPVYGSDRALGTKSWTELNGKTLEEGSLTDGKPFTFAMTPQITNHFTEAFQYIDLGKVHKITKMTWDSGDANNLGDSKHMRRVDVSYSTDGETYTAFPSLQGFDLYKKWGVNTFPIDGPIEARFIKLRYHANGERVEGFYMPEEVSVYDGIENDSLDLPSVGRVVASGKLTTDIPPRNFAALPITGKDPLTTGSYLIAAKVQAGGKTYFTWNHIFIKAGPYQANEKSRFGINADTPQIADSLQQLGVGWSRYENMKGPHVSDKPGIYDFTGSTVGPDNKDVIMQTYHDHGISVLPFVFLFPRYMMKDRDLPDDLSPFGEFTYQVVARYGSTKHPPDDLKTTDKKTGLGLIKAFEIWNEENQNNFGGWKGPSRYYEMYRVAAEAVKKADPTALVTNGGYSGLGPQLVDMLRTYKYADGKTPLDFTDVINVHFYTGQAAPEVCYINANTGTFNSKDVRSFEENLALLHEWRDLNKASAPIWLTETGYETDYIYFVDDRTQAAWLVRDILLCLANGMDKVMVFRETGSDYDRWAAAGVMRTDGTPKPSFFSYATLIRQFDGVEGYAHRLITDDNNVRIYTWKKGADTILTAWTVEGTASFPLNLGKATVVDTFGDKQDGIDTAGLKLTTCPFYISGYTDAAPLTAAIAKAVQAEEQHAALVKAQNALKAYLFGFGSKTDVGGFVVGSYRQSTPVVSADLYDATKGYGFNPAAQGDEDIKHNDPFNQHACQISKDIHFQIHAEPNTYVLRVGVMPLSHPAQVKVEGATDGAKAIDLNSDGEGEVELQAGSDPISISMDDRAELRWVTLIQKLPDDKK